MYTFIDTYTNRRFAINLDYIIKKLKPVPTMWLKLELVLFPILNQYTIIEPILGGGGTLMVKQSFMLETYNTWPNECLKLISELWSGANSYNFWFVQYSLLKMVSTQSNRMTQKYCNFPESIPRQKVWPIQSQYWLVCCTNPIKSIRCYHEEHPKIWAITFQVWILWFCRQQKGWEESR